MRRLGIYIICSLFPVLSFAAWVSVNYDVRTVAAMTSAYASEVAAETLND